MRSIAVDYISNGRHWLAWRLPASDRGQTDSPVRVCTIICRVRTWDCGVLTAAVAGSQQTQRGRRARVLALSLRAAPTTARAAAGARPAPMPADGADLRDESAPQGRALELVRFDSGRFVLGAAALGVLRSTSTPIAVVAVCGRARQVRASASQCLRDTQGAAAPPARGARQVPHAQPGAPHAPPRVF